MPDQKGATADLLSGLLKVIAKDAAMPEPPPIVLPSWWLARLSNEERANLERMVAGWGRVLRGS